MDVDKLVTSEETAVVSCQREEEMVRKERVTRNDDIVGFIDNKETKNMGVFDKFDKENVEKAEEYLDKLEGAIELEEEGGDIVEIFEDEAGIEGKIHDTLFRHLDYWEETGASDFALSVVKNGYVPQLWENPERYEEPNNKSYEREKEWVKVAVEKLKEARLVEETGREDLWCVNPLTVAMNLKGKRRL